MSKLLILLRSLFIFLSESYVVALTGTTSLKNAAQIQKQQRTAFYEELTEYISVFASKCPAVIRYMFYDSFTYSAIYMFRISKSE